MRERDINCKLFHKAHYEIIAKRFRISLEPYFDPNSDEEIRTKVGTYTRIQNPRVENQAARLALVNLALDMAKRFQADNEDFKPLIFLDRCSPNPELYPLSELWDA